MLLDKRVPFLYLFGQVKYDLLLVLIITTATYYLKRIYGDLVPKIPVSLPAFLGTAISLLLSFKLSQSYDRWWEARKIWGSIINDSRTLVRQLLTFTRPVHTTEKQPSDGDKTTMSNAAEPILADLNKDLDTDLGKANTLQTALRQISYRQIGWAYCLSRSLRKQDPLDFNRPDAPVETFINASDQATILQHQNKPLALTLLQGQSIAALYQKGYLNAFQQIQLDKTMTSLVNAMGQAERIKNTIFPVTYRQILIGFIYIFLIIMSMALLELNSIWEIPLDIIIALPFFLIEKTARFMQDPFENKPTDTAMTTIARTIEINIKQVWEDQQLPETQDVKGEFYIL